MLFRLGAPFIAWFLFVQIPIKARADEQLWAVYEHRVPLMNSAPTLPRLSLRVATETIFSSETALQTALLRVGPMLDVTSWLYLAAHGSVLTNKVGSTYEAQYRTELELNPYGALGRFKWNDRLRNEITFTSGGVPQYRLREMLRVSMPLQSHPNWIPFVAGEVFITPTNKQSVSEIRNMLGIGYKFSNDTRTDFGYCLRNIYEARRWQIDHALFFVILFDVPHKSGNHVVN